MTEEAQGGLAVTNDLLAPLIPPQFLPGATDAPEPTVPGLQKAHNDTPCVT